MKTGDITLLAENLADAVFSEVEQSGTLLKHRIAEAIRRELLACGLADYHRREEVKPPEPIAAKPLVGEIVAEAMRRGILGPAPISLKDISESSRYWAHDFRQRSKLSVPALSPGVVFSILDDPTE